MSRHQSHEIKINKKKFTKKFWKKNNLFEFILLAVKKTKLKAWKEARIGQGLYVTKWKGCIFIF